MLGGKPRGMSFPLSFFLELPFLSSGPEERSRNLNIVPNIILKPTLPLSHQESKHELFSFSGDSNPMEWTKNTEKLGLIS